MDQNKKNHPTPFISGSLWILLWWNTIHCRKVFPAIPQLVCVSQSILIYNWWTCPLFPFGHLPVFLSEHKALVACRLSILEPIPLGHCDRKQGLPQRNRSRTHLCWGRRGVSVDCSPPVRANKYTGWDWELLFGLGCGEFTSYSKMWKEKVGRLRNLWRCSKAPQVVQEYYYYVERSVRNILLN